MHGSTMEILILMKAPINDITKAKKGTAMATKTTSTSKLVLMLRDANVWPLVPGAEKMVSSSTAIAIGASVNASFDKGLMMTSHSANRVGNA